jgi:hypothetical protein
MQFRQHQPTLKGQSDSKIGWFLSQTQKFRFAYYEKTLYNESVKLLLFLEQNFFNPSCKPRQIGMVKKIRNGQENHLTPQSRY